MTKKFLVGFAIGFLLLSATISADAATIAGNYQVLSSPPPTTNYDYGTVDFSLGDVMLTVIGTNLDIAEGTGSDYSYTEWVNIELNGGTWSQKWGEHYSHGSTWEVSVNGREVTFTDNLTISKDVWNSMAGSGLVLSLSWGSGVNYLTDLTPDTISWSFNYRTAPVPEPATLFLLGFGLLGIAGVSRKKN